MNELPETWATCPFLSVADLLRGVTYTKADSRSDAFSGSVPVLRANNIQDRRFDLTDLVHVPKRLVADQQLVRRGDVVVATSSGSISVVGKAAQALEDMNAGFGAFCGLLRPKSGINAPYFGFFFSTDVYRKTVSALARGVNINNLKREHFESLELPIAPLNEQKRIADKLEAVLGRVDACRARLDRVPDLLKRFRQSVLAAATTGQLTEDWREKNDSIQPNSAQREVAELIEARRKASSPKAKFKEPASADMSQWKLEVPPSWSVESVSAFAECLDSIRVPVKREKRANTKGLYPYYGANGEVDRVDEYLFDDELVLVTEDETFYGREKPIAYRSSGKCWVNNHAHVLRAADETSCDYLCYALMYYEIIPWLTGTTGRAKLTQGVLNALPIAVPPKVERIEIVRRVKALFAMADRIEARLTAARAQVERLTPATLSKAFRGDLVPRDPDDEPASKLLERLNKDCSKAAQPRTKARKAKTTA